VKKGQGSTEGPRRSLLWLPLPFYLMEIVSLMAFSALTVCNIAVSRRWWLNSMQELG